MNDFLGERLRTIGEYLDPDNDPVKRNGTTTPWSGPQLAARAGQTMSQEQRDRYYRKVIVGAIVGAAIMITGVVVASVEGPSDQAPVKSPVIANSHHHP